MNNYKYNNNNKLYLKELYVSRNSVKLGNNKMAFKLRETQKKTLKTVKEG